VKVSMITEIFMIRCFFYHL